VPGVLVAGVLLVAARVDGFSFAGFDVDHFVS
jgi:hypothetical protein